MSGSNKSTSELTAGLAVSLVIGLFCLLMAGYYVPAFDGVDENGYLCTARRMVLRGTTVKQIAHPIEYVSDNVVQTGDNTFYAKYPLGYPWLCAVAYWLGGPSAVFLVNPILAVIALIGMYLLARAMINTFAGVLAVILLATNPWHGDFGIASCSHTGSITFAVCGMYFLWRWVERGGIGNAIGAGSLIAYTYNMRYSEALLVFPVLAMMAWRYFHLPADRKERITRCRYEIAVMILFALAVIAPLWWHHWVAYGAPWKTGYGLCDESTGFGWQWMKKNWWLMLSKLNGLGLFFVFPIGLAGLAYVVAHDKRRALFLCTWALPCILLYSSYYWGMDIEGGYYIRFFYSVFPALIIATLILLCEAAKPRRSWSIALGMIVAVIAVVNWRDAFKEMSELSEELQPYEMLCDQVRRHVPDGSIIVSPAESLDSLEFIGDYELYSTQTFDRERLTWRTGSIYTPGPHPFQLRKAVDLENRLGHLNDGQLADLQRSILSSNMAAGRSVVLVLTTDHFRHVRGQLGEDFTFKQLTEWYQTTHQRNSAPVTLLVGIYQLQRRDKNQPAGDNLTALAAKIDQLQFRTRVLRQEYDQNYPGARQQLATIGNLRGQVPPLQVKARQLAITPTNSLPAGIR